jgi:hypothetical protein
MAHLLVRNKLSEKPLVPLDSILSIELVGVNPNEGLAYSTSTSSSPKFRWDPNENNRNGDPSTWTSQACYAYYVHRCLPERPDMMLDAMGGKEGEADGEEDSEVDGEVDEEEAPAVRGQRRERIRGAGGKSKGVWVTKTWQG